LLRGAQEVVLVIQPFERWGDNRAGGES